MSDALREAVLAQHNRVRQDRSSEECGWCGVIWPCPAVALALAAPPPTVNLQDIIEYLMEQKETGGDLTRQRAEVLLDGLAELSESNHD